MALTRRESRSEALPELFGWNWVDRFFPGRFFPEWLSGEFETMASSIRVEEYTEDGTLVVHAELPGVDPDKDVEISVHDGMLDIRAERHEEDKPAKGRSEFRYGSFRRMLTLPADVTEKEIKATYKDGVLEIRVPLGRAGAEAKRIPVSRG